jgi:hypothetical protein
MHAIKYLLVLLSIALLIDLREAQVDQITLDSDYDTTTAPMANGYLKTISFNNRERNRNSADTTTKRVKDSTTKRVSKKKNGKKLRMRETTPAPLTPVPKYRETAKKMIGGFKKGVKKIGKLVMGQA